MRRWLTATLAFILIITQMPFALAEEESPLEAPPGLATEVEAEGLTVDLGDGSEPVYTVVEEAEAASDPIPEDAVEIADMPAEEIAPETEDMLFAAAGFVLEATSCVVPVSGTYQLVALDAAGKAIDPKAMTYKSDNPAAATVSVGGVVTGIKAGSAVVTAAYNGQSASCAVTVPGEPTKVKLTSPITTLGVGERYDGLTVQFTPADAAAAVTFTSSNTRVIAVDPETGAVTALKTGSSTITAKARNGKKATLKIRVKKATTSLTVTPASVALGYGGAKQQLTLGFTKNAVCNTVTFSSSDNSVATVDQNGLVTSVNGGTAVITAQTYNGIRAACAVTVYDAPASVRFAADPQKVGTGETVTLKAIPVDKAGRDTQAALTFSVEAASANKNCISLDAATGAIKGLSSGSAIIRATAANGATGTCAVQVVPVPSAITLNESKLTLGATETYGGLVATLVPPRGETTCFSEITWTSSKPKVVTVDPETGFITTLKTGSSTITARTSNGRTATCKVSVKKAPTKITVTPANLKLGAGGMTGALKYKLTASSSASVVTWTTSDARVATVDAAGVITSVGEGTAVITASTFNGKTASATVSVCGEPGRVTLNQSAATVGMGDKLTLKAEATTARGNETLTTLTYYIDSNSPDPGCVTVNASTGVITAVRKGIAWVNARTHNGVAADAPCVVTVTPKAKKLTLPDKFSMGVDEHADALEAILTFQDGSVAPASGLTWTSSKPKYLAVDADTGALTALKKGSATITAKTSGGLKATCKVTIQKAPTSATMTPASVKLSAGGMNFQLGVTVSSGSANEVTYTSSNPSVATVNSKGLLTTVGAGRATITAETYNGLKATCAVTVTEKPYTAAFGTTQMTLGVSQTATPVVNVKAQDGSDAAADLKFTVVQGQEYVRVDANTGVITALKAGTSVISVTTHNDVRASNSCTVTVIAAPTAIKLSDSGIYLGVKDTYKLTARVTAPKGADTGVTWTSSDTGVATVSSTGLVTAKATGTVTITAETSNGLTAECAVKVFKAPTSITLSPASGSIYVGEFGQYTVKMSSGSFASITFTSSDPSVADIDENGVVEGISPGTVTITATAYNGKKSTAKLTVKKQSGSGSGSGGSYGYDADIESVIGLAESVLGMPYKSKGGYKSESPDGFDCSGLVYWAYWFGANIKLKDSPSGQCNDSTYERIDSVDDLERGDVVCFHGDGSSSCNHTGIYLGGGEFIHASSAASGVIITEISKDYYARNFICGRRIIG